MGYGPRGSWWFATATLGVVAMLGCGDSGCSQSNEKGGESSGPAQKSAAASSREPNKSAASSRDRPDEPDSRDDRSAQGSARGVAWAKALGTGKTYVRLRALAVQDDQLIAGGLAKGDLSLGGNTLTGTLIATLSREGSYGWSSDFGGPAGGPADAVAVGPQGQIAVAGTFSGPIEMGDRRVEPKGGSDLFLRRFKRDGEPAELHLIGVEGPLRAHAVALDKDRHLYMAGYFKRTINMGKGPIEAEGAEDIAVLSLTEQGQLRWWKTFGSEKVDEAHGVRVDARGNVYVAGYFGGGIDFGGGKRKAAGGRDMFVVSYDPDGAHRWTKSFGSNARGDEIRGLALDGQGRLYLTGSFGGEIDFGGGSRKGQGIVNAFVASLDGDGGHRWSKALAGEPTGWTKALDVAVDAEGEHLCITGNAMDKGEATDASVAAFATEDGSPLWSKRFGGSPADSGHAVAAAPTGGCYVAGHFGGKATLGNRTFEASARGSAFLARVEGGD